MDHNGNSDGQPKRKRPRTLKKLLFIPFYDGILTGDISETGLSEDEFTKFASEFFRSSGKTKSSIDEQLKEKKYDIAVLSGCLFTLTNGYDEDIADIIRGFGIEISEETFIEAVEIITNKLERLHKDYKILESQKPPVPKTIEEMTSYDVLANLASNLEFSINFSTFTVGEYLSFTRVVKRKSDALKKARNGRSVGKN